MFDDRMERVAMAEHMSKGGRSGVQIQVEVGDSVVDFEVVIEITERDGLDKVGVENAGVFGDMGRGELEAKACGGVEMVEELGGDLDTELFEGGWIGLVEGVLDGQEGGGGCSVEANQASLEFAVDVVVAVVGVERCSGGVGGELGAIVERLAGRAGREGVPGLDEQEGGEQQGDGLGREHGEIGRAHV